MPKVVKQTTKAAPKKTASTGGSVLDRIAPLEAEDDTGIKINLYGRSGTGKTTLWSSFPAPILAILCSGGNKPGELKSINTPANRKRIQKVVLQDSNDIFTIAQHQAETGQYKTIVLDHASGVQDYVLKEVLGLNEIPTQLSWGLATQQQYGQVAVRMKELLRSLLNLDCNVVIVAQERDFNTEGDSSELLMPFVASALTPSVVGWLNPACDYICQTYLRTKTKEKKTKVGDKEITTQEPTREVEYCLRVAPDPVFTTKFRIPKGRQLPPSIIDPTYEKLMKAISG